MSKMNFFEFLENILNCKKNQLTARYSKKMTPVMSPTSDINAPLLIKISPVPPSKLSITDSAVQFSKSDSSGTLTNCQFHSTTQFYSSNLLPEGALKKIF